MLPDVVLGVGGNNLNSLLLFKNQVLINVSVCVCLHKHTWNGSLIP